MFVVKRLLWVVGGVVVLILATGMLMASLYLLNTFGATGSVASDSTRLSGDGAALIVDGVRISGGSPLQREMGTLTLGARSDDGRPLFIGVAPEDPLFGYLDGTPYDIVTSIDSVTSTVRPVPGAGSPSPPGSQSFWSQRASGVTPHIDWPSATVSKGSRLVVMNEDGSAGVAATLVLGFVSSRIYPASTAGALVGVLLFIPALWMLYRGFRRRRASLPTSPPATPLLMAPHAPVA